MTQATPARWKRWGKAAVAVALCLAYSLFAHLAATHATPGVTDVMLSLFWLLALAVSLAWRTAQRGAWLALCAAGVAGLASAMDWLLLHYQWFFLLEHAGIQSLLGIGFGRTLAAGQTPMVSRFAAVVHGPLSPRLQRYTRGVTWAWTLYFAAMAGTSVLLFCLAPIAWWSRFANLLSLPLIVLMFVGEYLMRRCVLPPEDVAGLWQALQAYRRVAAQPQA